MSLKLEKAGPRDAAFIFSLAQNGAHNGHFDARINRNKDAYRAYINAAITRESDPEGIPTRAFVAIADDMRIGAAVTTAALGTPDGGIELALIAVKNAHRGHGSGAWMLDTLLNYYLPRGSVYARCFPASETLRQMLIKRGFVPAGSSGQSLILRHGQISL